MYLGAQPNRGLKMPRRKTTRAQDRAKRIEAERRLNDDHVTERNRPHPHDLRRSGMSSQV